MEEKEEKFVWTERDRKNTNRIMAFGFLTTMTWITFLLTTLAPSCPTKSAQGNYSDGKYYFDKKEYVKAYLYYTRSIKLNPDYSQAYWERATTGMKIDSVENTIDDLTKFISISKNADSLRNAYFMRATAEDKGGYKSDACDDFEVACELNLNKACDIYREKCK